MKIGKTKSRVARANDSSVISAPPLTSAKTKTMNVMIPWIVFVARDDDSFQNEAFFALAL